MKDFLEQLRIQRFDDHRFYHHSTINQSLHLVSALSFIASYCLLFVDPAMAGLTAWLVSMTSRQAGHFFFEPKGYDDVNRVTHEHKEEIKVGYNLRRKVVLMAIWAVSPLVLWFDRGFFGLIEPSTGAYGSGSTRAWGPVWCGPPRSSPTRFMTPSFIVAHRYACCAASSSIRWTRFASTADSGQARCVPRKRVDSTSRKIPRRIVRLVSSGLLHHQPSFRICWPASMKRASTVSKSASL
jgi:hypothetical protein